MTANLRYPPFAGGAGVDLAGGGVQIATPTGLHINDLKKFCIDSDQSFVEISYSFLMMFKPENFNARRMMDGVSSPAGRLRYVPVGGIIHEDAPPPPGQRQEVSDAAILKEFSTLPTNELLRKWVLLPDSIAYLKLNEIHVSQSLMPIFQCSVEGDDRLERWVAKIQLKVHIS